MAEYVPRSKNLFQKEDLVAKCLNGVFDTDYTGRQVYDMSHNQLIQNIYNLFHYVSIMEIKVVITDRNYGEGIKYLFQLLLLLEYEPAQASSQFFWDLISEHSDETFLVLYWIANNEEWLQSQAHDFKRKAYFLGFSPSIYALDDTTGTKIPGEWKPLKPPRKYKKGAKKAQLKSSCENGWLRLPAEKSRPKARKIKECPIDMTRFMCKDYAEKLRDTYQSKIRNDLEILVVEAMSISDKINNKTPDESETEEACVQPDAQSSTSSESFLLPKDPNIEEYIPSNIVAPLQKSHMQEMLLEQIDSNSDEQNTNLLQHLVDTNMFHEIFDDSMDTFLANFSLGSKLDLENVTDNGIDNEKPTTSTFYKEVPDYEDDSEPEVKKSKK